MSTSIIQQKISEPEYVTQSVKVSATLRWSSGTEVTISLDSSTTNVNSATATMSSSYVTALNFDVAKSGYTLVGITSIPSGSSTTPYAYIRTRESSSSTTIHYSGVTVSGNTIVLTPNSSVSLPTVYSHDVYIGTITCKYIEN